MKIDKDDFEEWLAHPITEAMMRMLEIGDKEIEAAWLAASLEGGGNCDPMLLTRLRERRSVYRELRQITADMIEEKLA